MTGGIANVVRRGVGRQVAVDELLTGASSGCPQCGFAIWTPLMSLPASTVGLYDDARYPGRLLVSAREHYDHLDQMPARTLAAFMADVQRVAGALRGWDDVARVNVAILGNKAAHVHAHLIPRRATEPNFTRAPWDGAEPLRPLAAETKTNIVDELCQALTRVAQTARSAVAINGRNADPCVVADKMARIRQPHVAARNNLADRIASVEHLPAGYVPYVDPDLGGVNARMLVLLDNPSTKAEAGTGSGLQSLDNNDRTARNCREAYVRHGIDRCNLVHWNVVPFPVAGAKNGGSTPAERSRAARWTREVIDLLPNLEIVLLLGAAARDGWKKAAINRADIVVPSGNIPHCSARGLNTAGGRERFDAAIQQAAELLSDHD